jgi:hypothetical protein
MKQPGLDDRHRDKNGEIRHKNSNTLVRTLRKEFGDDFAKGYRSDATLGTVLKKEGNLPKVATVNSARGHPAQRTIGRRHLRTDG